MERISRFRSMILLLLFTFVLMLYGGRLFFLQIIDTDGNTDNTATYTTLTTVRAARGDILDRNGNVLVGNRASYDLVFNHYVIKSADNRNEYLYRLVAKCKELGVEYLDHFPITKSRPFVYTLNDYNTAWRGYFQNFMLDRDLDSDISAPLLIERLRERYDIPEEWDEDMARAVVGIRYEFDLRGVTNLPTYTFIEDVSDEHLSAILELNTPGLMVESSTVREYHTEYAAHILGYVGGMDSTDWEKYKSQNYSMDAYIGQAGMEEAFEEYLHGIDGTRVDVVSRDGTIISQYYANKYDDDGNIIGKYEPVAGNNVETSIDLDIQIATEDALKRVMEEIKNDSLNQTVGQTQGLDAEGAAAVVMDVKTGEILACASYPTYNLATMNEDWAEIEADPDKPFFNRAFGATYAPGSTFKMVTLTAALNNRNSKGEWVFRGDETILTKGIYTEMPGFTPTCMIWSVESPATHGELDATDALRYSCNYFFYELAYRLNIDMIDKASKGYGLGEPTGIELLEKVGHRSNEESKKASYTTAVNQQWSAGDRVLTGIGQAENRFTPLQLCVYASTLANKGTRMKATFLNRVVSSDYRTLILDQEPQVLSTMEDVSWETWEIIFTGMRKVIASNSGTADDFLGGFNDANAKNLEWPKDGVRWPLANEVTVYAKTGTSEHSSGGSDHGAFICFAHRKELTEPEVAVAVFGEKAAHGNWLAPVAEDILEAYFEQVSASTVYTYENQVG
ncbi:MAG: hypothetical protein IKY96_06175 [Oscillospiraceae bacterium]|nr:hypothetical protein [Oscillospiraceae bacterium]